MAEDAPLTLSPLSATNEATSAIGVWAAAIVWCGLLAAGITARDSFSVTAQWLGAIALSIAGAAIVTSAWAGRKARRQAACFGRVTATLSTASLEPGSRFTVRVEVPTASPVAARSAVLRLVRWNRVPFRYGIESRRKLEWRPKVLQSVDVIDDVVVTDSGLHAEGVLTLPESAAPATDKRHWRLELLVDVEQCASSLWAEFPLDVVAGNGGEPRTPVDSTR